MIMGGNAFAQGNLEEPEVGETVILNKFNKGFFSGYEKFSATCQAIGEHVYMYTEDAHVNDIYGQEIDGTFKLYAATTWGVFISEDMGETWRYLDQIYELPTSTDGEHTNPLGETFIEVSPPGDLVFTGTNAGLYYSRDGGESWNSIRTLPASVAYYDIAFDTTAGVDDRSSVKYFASSDGLYYRDGSSLLARTNISTGMPIEANLYSTIYDIHLIQGGALYLATSAGPFTGMVNEDEEFSWDPIIKRGVNFTVETDDSTDAMQFSLQEEYDAYSISLSSHVFVVDEATGARWAGSPYQGEYADGTQFTAFDLSEENMYFSGDFEGDYTTLDPANIKMFISGGQVTTQIERQDDGTLFMVTEGGVFKTSDGVNVESLGLDTLEVNDLVLDNGNLWAATNQGLYYSENASGSWEKRTPMLGDGLGVDEMDFESTSIFKTPSNTIFVGNTFGGVLKGDGQNWQTANTGLIHRGTPLEAIHKTVTSFDDSSLADPTKGIYEMTTEYFGEPVNGDGMDKVFVVVTDLIDSYFLLAGNGVDYDFSRFDPVDQMDKSQSPNSNARDLLYLDNYPLKIEKSLSGDPANTIDSTATQFEAEASLAHALARMILYNYDQDEEEWLAEGFAMWARWINGYKFYSKPSETAYLNLTSLKPKDRNNLLAWGDSDDLRREREASFAFFDFLYEKYLQTSENTRTLLQDTANGMNSLSPFLGDKSFSDIYEEYSLTLYFDQLGDQFKGGMYALNNIDLEYRVLPPNWGFLPGTEPPYNYVFPGYSWYYYVADFYNGSQNGAPSLDSVVVFNGDDQSTFHVYAIEQKSFEFDPDNFSESDVKITKLELDERNRAEYIPDAKRSEDDPDEYVQLHLMVVSNEPATIDGGAFTLSAEVQPPQMVSFYPLQNKALDKYFEIYAFSDEKLYMDGGMEFFLGADEAGQGPMVEASNGDMTASLNLSTFFTDESNIFVYKGLFDLDSLLVGESGQISFTEYGEDIAGNRIAPLSMGPLNYKLAKPGLTLAMSDKDNNIQLIAEEGMDEQQYVTLFTIPKANSKRLEKLNENASISDTYILGPVGRHVENTTITLSYADLEIADIEKLGIYVKTDGQWKYVDSEVNPTNKTVSAEIDYLGQYRLQSGDVTSEVVDNIPDQYKLSQNYPNPFNPSTVINYQLPQNSKVQLVIYNALGQKVATLIDKKQEAGYHSYKFDINTLEKSLPSGIYFYTIKAGSFHQTKKMLLVK